MGRNNSTNLGQLGQNISQIGSMFNPGQVSTVGAPSTGGYFPGGGGAPAPTNEKLDIFGRPVG